MPDAGRGQGPGGPSAVRLTLLTRAALKTASSTTSLMPICCWQWHPGVSNGAQKLSVQATESPEEVALGTLPRNHCLWTLSLLGWEVAAFREPPLNCKHVLCPSTPETWPATEGAESVSAFCPSPPLSHSLPLHCPNCSAGLSGALATPGVRSQLWTKETQTHVRAVFKLECT